MPASAKDDMDQTGRRCTVERRNSRFCNQPSIEDAPFPICGRHARELYMHVRDTIGDVLSDPIRRAGIVDEVRLATYDDVMGPHLQWVRDRDPKVYYLRLNDLIKIGTTGNLKSRLSSYPPGCVLLATEPGSTETEAQRHAQFARYRVRGEWFRPGESLLAHIATLVAAAA